MANDLGSLAIQTPACTTDNSVASTGKQNKKLLPKWWEKRQNSTPKRAAVTKYYCRYYRKQQKGYYKYRICDGNGLYYQTGDTINVVITSSTLAHCPIKHFGATGNCAHEIETFELENIRKRLKFAKKVNLRFYMNSDNLIVDNEPTSKDVRNNEE